MRTFLLAVLGAFVGGGYEAFQTIELIRVGAYSLAQGSGIILAGAIVDAAVFAAVFAIYRVFASPRK
jgi:hypothetical protein